MKALLLGKALADYEQEIKLINPSEEFEVRKISAQLIKKITDQMQLNLDENDDDDDQPIEELIEKLKIIEKENLTQKPKGSKSETLQFKINQISDEFLQNYEDELQKFIKNGPQPAPDFDERNEELVATNLKFYRTMLKGLNIQKDLEKLEELQGMKLKHLFEKYRMQNYQSYDGKTLKIKAIITKCLQKYQDAVGKEIYNVQTTKELQCLHESAYCNAMMNFQMECQVGNDPSISNQYRKTLKDEIESHFQEISELHELRLKKEEGDIIAELKKARELYKEEMESHFANNATFDSQKLKRIHHQVSEQAIRIVPNLNSNEKEKLRSKLLETFVIYKERNAMNCQEDYAIGIDLGTTFSCVAVYKDGDVQIIRNEVGRFTTPSYVAIKNGKEIVGDAAKSQSFTNPENTIFDSKRILGRPFNDPQLQQDMKLWPFSVIDDNSVPKIMMGGKLLHPEEISAKILRKLKADAEKYLERKVTKAVITVPVYFTDGQRQATIDAGEMAGLQVLSILNEPTAAAIAYKLQHSDDTNNRMRNVLIYDLGGGTFDVAVMTMSKGKIDILAVDGDTHLGGEDFDKALMEYCAQEFKKSHKIDLFEGKDSTSNHIRNEVRRGLKRLQNECESRKKELETARFTFVNVDGIKEDFDLDVSITRDKFEELNMPYFEKTIEIVDNALASAKLHKSKIDDIVLIGGSTRIPKVQSMLRMYFGGKMLDCSINPDEAVAFGAAMRAAVLNGKVKKESEKCADIQDVTSMSIGVQLHDGAFSVIIHKSTKIPVRLTKRYKTTRDYQSEVTIIVYQGENKVAAENVLLGKFSLGVPPRMAGMEEVDVEMHVDAQGILHVSGISSSTGAGRAIVIENRQRMDRDAIRRHIKFHEVTHL